MVVRLLLVASLWAIRLWRTDTLPGLTRTSLMLPSSAALGLKLCNEGQSNSSSLSNSSSCPRRPAVICQIADLLVMRQATRGPISQIGDHGL
jgi:hypothetical protein